MKGKAIISNWGIFEDNDFLDTFAKQLDKIITEEIKTNGYTIGSIRIRKNDILFKGYMQCFADDTNLIVDTHSLKDILSSEFEYVEKETKEKIIASLEQIIKHLRKINDRN